MFEQGLMPSTSTMLVCISDVYVDEVWEFFELTEVVDDAKKYSNKKVIFKLCEGVTLAYAGGASNMSNHLETKHPVTLTYKGNSERMLYM